MIVIDDELKKEVGKRLLALRKAYNYTIDDVVDKINTDYYLNIDEKSIRRYEKGEFLPKIDFLIVFCELYNVSLDYIIFGKKTSDDNSYTWSDSFKRLNRLMFSEVLLPFKEEDKSSKYYGKYYFVGYDEELKVYMDRLMNFSLDKNYSFEVRGKNPKFNIDDLDNLIQEFSEYKEQLSPSIERLDDVLMKSGYDPDEFLKEKIEDIKKRRKNRQLNFDVF